MARTLEADILVPTLKGLATNGCMDTAARLAYLEGVMTLSEEDLEILNNRNDTRFSQIVRNQVSHRNDEGNIVAEGYATYDPVRGLCITDKGRKLISR
ncbi:hypothetical protein Q8W71_23505 [Methylobacterium sp. NEAU 140]|uniref:hypothetical protein n=1 Tax=Methylobacterium sp. NEAU 140 TaxID=3064945 RepID=UPI0027353F75|nr:hypothetical protein [Methylobacterium sp. NEAU 140]MDP4025605.1 hypothetical protein [Methylobacterium sp. NEAU 140]